ncbi:MAG: tripartite tricarboxylate transporter permease [Spirochaetia bacterium]|nr:tripartite tricarboxylate transporter permease [Spirochaetia bacterium]MBO7094509.1 tripartite tricarboxylate transporter permease [Spirochaetia bacterium]MBO7516444.1 tripartite tricarboxylate transporter permease [Spirochaetia bacterium]
MADILSNLAMGFSVIASFQALFLVLLGVCVGILGGAIPGISPSMAVALLLPITYSLSPIMAMVMLMGIYIGANYGGSITAIAINTPGTPSATVTAFDGYPMLKNGKAGEAMGISLWASVIGGIIGAVILIFFSVPLSKVALKFWPSEYFALCIMGLTTVATLGGKNWQKALVTCLFGLLLNTVGLDPTFGIKRFTFKVTKLFDGFEMVPVLIGLFALGEVLSNLEHYKTAAVVRQNVDYKLPKLIYYWKLKFSIIRAGIIGCIIGIFPGAGGTIASFLAYDTEKRMSKHPDDFGHGAPEGVAAAEASNSGSVGGAMVPLLTLGIPGSSTAAVLLSALMIHNLNPGPKLFTEQPELVYGLFASMFAANLFMVLVGTYGSKLWVRVGYIKKTILYPLIFAFAILGSYSIKKSMFDVGTCLAFGLVGWMFKKYKYPASPLVLGLILGKLIETNYVQTLMVTGPIGFVQRPFTVILFVISIAALVYPVISARIKAKKMNNSRQ